MQIATGTRALAISASRDGRTIVFASEGGLWATDADGSNSRIICCPNGGVPSISPDGTFVTFVAFVPTKRTLMRVGTDGTHPEVLSSLSAQPVPSAVSPDSRWVAFVYDRGGAKGTPVAVIPASGGEPVTTLLLPGPLRIQWTPDGKSITYIREDRGIENLWTQPVFGGSEKQLTHFNEGRIFRFAWSADGRQLAVAHGSQTRDVLLLRAAQ